MKKVLIYNVLFLVALDNVACTRANEENVRKALPGTAEEAPASQNSKNIKIVREDIFDYINKKNRISHSNSWSVLDKTHFLVDSLVATLVNANRRLVYKIYYPVFKGPVFSVSNSYYKKWYASQLAQDSIDNPTIGMSLRMGIKKYKYEKMEQIEYYNILPLQNSTYTAPGGAVFISSSATYTFAGGSDNLSGLTTQLVRLGTPVRDFAQEFDESVYNRGWPELTNLVQQQSGATFKQLSDSSSINRQFFLASKGLVIDFESIMDSNDSFLVEIPYQVFNERFNQ